MFSFGLLRERLRPFNVVYKCHSVLMLAGKERSELERGGKIIMPSSALDTLSRHNISYPMLFKLTNINAFNRFTHCGVLEFVAEEGKVYIPFWMMRNLLIEEGSLVQVECATLPVASFSRFQPQSPEFLDIHNQKAVLENALRNFACLTTGDVIAITYNDKVYELCVLETRPGSAVSIIECDMNVEFAEPVGRDESVREETVDEDTINTSAISEVNEGFAAFGGTGKRLDGKMLSKDMMSDKTVPKSLKRGIPDYNYQIGTLEFIRTSKPIPTTDQSVSDSKSDFEPFKGEGQTLSNRK